MMRQISRRFNEKERKLGPVFYGSATVGPNGQIVLPAKLKKDPDIEPGDAPAVISKSKGKGFHLFLA